VDTNLKVILQQLEAEKSVDRNTLIEAIRSAIESAARKGMNHAANVLVDVDPDTIKFKVFEVRTVVEKVADPITDISLEDALKLNPGSEIGHKLKVPAEPKDFGRIAAQTAKQVIIQKIKDAERDNIFEEFSGREGELVTGIVKRNAHGNILVMVDRAEAVIPPREQTPRESLKPGDRVRAVLVLVEKGQRGAQVVLSRSTPELVKLLFRNEVPEIFDGTIEIRGIAREPGSRTKVAVHSRDSNVDPVGACVGMKGTRVRTVVEELRGEKIDIIRWSEDPEDLCQHALNPADILSLTLDEDTKTILVVVPSDQLSLAIGKKGQNARLASKLVGWNIDIRSDEEMRGGGRDEAGRISAGISEDPAEAVAINIGGDPSLR
jgi:N utilization substance protein A